MSVIHINESNFRHEVLNADHPVLRDFWAPWCGPCRMVGPILDQIAAERPDVKVCKVNVDEQPELASRFGVMSIPMLAVMKNGKIVSSRWAHAPKRRFWPCCKEVHCMGLFDFLRGPDINQGVKEFRAASGAVLLDVRTPDEYRGGHIPGSKNVPLQSIDKVGRIVENKHPPIYVHCLSGGRSSQPALALGRMGYTSVKNIGGISAYTGKRAQGA